MKSIYMGLVLLAMAVLAAGCTTTTATDTALPEISADQVTRLESETSDGQETQSASDPQTDDGQKGEVAPVGPADQAKGTRVIGIVQKVYGNTLKVERVELPEGMADRMGGGRPESAEKNGEINNVLAGATSGMPMGGPGGGKRGGGGTNMSFEGSGEFIDVVIPVGTEISSMADRGEAVDLDQLTKGMVIQLVIDNQLTAEMNDGEITTYYVDRATVMQ